jgi:hypothetical protein
MADNSAEVIRKEDGFPATITPEAERRACPDHPDGGSRGGFGYAGGGFGPYQVCVACGTIFGKTQVRQ